MAIEYYSSIDLNKNELQNAVVQNAGSAPGSPSEGQIYYDSTSGDKALHFYNGSAWVRVGGQIIHQTTDTIASGDFLSFADVSQDGDASTDSVNDFNNKLTVDNFITTSPKLLTETAIANGDYIMFLDGGSTGDAKKESLADLATLFAGAGMTATSSVLNVIGGDGITASANDIEIDAAQTTITSVLNNALVVGRDATDQIKFSTNNQIIFRVNGGDGVIFKGSGEIAAASLDISGNIDIDGTANLDAVDIDGVVNFAAQDHVMTNGANINDDSDNLMIGFATNAVTLGSPTSFDSTLTIASDIIHKDDTNNKSELLNAINRSTKVREKILNKKNNI